MSDMIITSECEQCIHSIINEEDKARIKVYCSVKDKTYFWDSAFHVIIKKLKRSN